MSDTWDKVRKLQMASLYGRAAEEARPMTPAERKARQRARRQAAGLPARTAAEKAASRARKGLRPFVGADGEGCGVDELGRQLYQLFRIGERELFTGRPLGTAELLDFICDHPRGPLIVGFSFGYDVTMILRDLNPERRGRLLATKDQGPGHSRYTYWRDYAIEFLPRNYLRVARTRPMGVAGYRDGRPLPKRVLVPNSSRTIYDTFAFFQCSFLQALKDWDIGSIEQREEIERNKALRAEFASITPTVRAYCAMECQLMADMLQKFRAACFAADIRPRTWNGAGKLAGALHQKYGTMTAEELGASVPAGVRAMAQAAYYGGRFEVTRTGAIEGPVYEYDIRSAYPAAMLKLPCLVHGEWRRATPARLKRLEADPSAPLYLSRLRFDHDPDRVAAPGQDRAANRANLCGLPVRKKDGRLFWPGQANGTYWSVEIRAAAKHGCRVTHREGWEYVNRCDCKQFQWVNELYEYRKSIGAATMGMPIKLGINALYGRLAQRIGRPRWANMVWAGLITAHTRAALLEAAADDPGAVVMLATDALFSRRPLAVPLGTGLGEWEQSVHDRLFIVQPGVYWGGRKPKTRGISPGFFADKTDIFEAAWATYAEADRATFWGESMIPKRPSVTLPVNLFIGMKLAQARGKPETAGKWVEQARNFRFDWSAKRGLHEWETPLCVWTRPPDGAADLVSLPHKADMALIADLDMEKLEMEDQPDYLDMTPPWRD